jgi:hypothetical protein
MLRRTPRFIALVGLMALAFGGVATTARADFDILIFSDATLTTLLYSIDDNGPGDSNLNLGQIGTSATGDLGSLNAAVAATGLEFDDLSATSNAGSPPLDNIANLTVGGKVHQLAGFAGPNDLWILVSANDYSFPAGPTYVVGSSASHTFTTVGLGTAPDFTSYFNGSNTLNATETATATLVFAPPAGTSSDGQTAADLITAGTTNFGLSNLTHIHLVGATASDQFQGTTTVRSIPEPGSLALLALGGSGLFFGYVRRRKAQA